MSFDAVSFTRVTQSAARGFDLAALLGANSTNALDLIDRHVNPAFASVLRTIGFDVRFTRGQGAYLYDDRGNKFIDCLGGYAVFAAGRNHPVIRDALKQAMDLDLPNLPGLGTFRVAGLLARELAAIAPRDPRDGSALDTVFFASGGGEAVDAALKHARAATSRERIIHCRSSYHGLTFGALSVTGANDFRDGFGPLLNTTEIPFDDAEALERELARGDVAAFICEPIQGKCVGVPSSGYLRAASEACRRHGAMFILDEVQTGLGRTGRMFAGEHDGMGQTWRPDMLVISKALSGGYVPVSALLTTKVIHQKVFTSMNNCSRIQTTFGMNDLAMVAGLATLHVLRTERLIENAADVGTYLLDGLRQAIGGSELVKEIRGRGLMIGIEFHRPRSLLLAQAWDMLHHVDPSLFCQAVILPLISEHRILAQVSGHRQDIIKLIPPLVLSRADADEIIRALRVCITNCEHLPGPVYQVGKRLGSAAIKRMANGTSMHQHAASL